jgi:hypothetical protein
MGGQVQSRASRVFRERPDRVAAAWRRLRSAQLPVGETPQYLLNDVVEPFIREVGASLSGAPGSPWSRTRGVLRISPSRGAPELYDEFSALRRCLLVSLEALGATDDERVRVEEAVDEATHSAVAIQSQLEKQVPAAPPPLPFGGVVLEVFEQNPPRAASEGERSAQSPLVH